MNFLFTNNNKNLPRTDSNGQQQSLTRYKVYHLSILVPLVVVVLETKLVSALDVLVTSVTVVTEQDLCFTQSTAIR